jgi:hypothetical protein
MENVPQLLSMMGFSKSCLMIFGYKITFKTIRIKNMPPMPPKRYLKYGWMSWTRLPSENNARINPEAGKGNFFTIFIFIYKLKNF